MKAIVLASESPRRKSILKKAGIKFKIVKSDFKEYVDPKLTPHQLAKKLSLEKAKAVYKKHRKSIIIAADTLVVCNGKILGKPKNEKDARQMLLTLSNKTHLIITGFTIIDGNLNSIVTKSQVSKVYMREITSAEIDSYIKTREPYDKAGAYAIQGKAKQFIEKIEGDLSNAIGLPIHSLMAELKKLDIK